MNNAGEVVADVRLKVAPVTAAVQTLWSTQSSQNTTAMKSHRPAYHAQAGATNTTDPHRLSSKFARILEIFEPKHLIQNPPGTPANMEPNVSI